MEPAAVAVEEMFIVEVLDLHFKAVVFEPDGSHLHSVIFKEFPDVRLLELDGIVPDVDLVLSPDVQGVNGGGKNGRSS